MNATKRAQVPFGLRKKLMAATSMLLVAAIMLVSTSYAWFTLSTAPEITGITTSVGANGNLEIALLTTETFANTDAISSGTGDSMENTANEHTVKDANTTWGNLVDLSDGSYGLDKIVLYPSVLNITGEGSFNTTSPLGYPEYGFDGRVNKVATATLTASYRDGLFKQADDGADYGVRAVGTSAAASARELIWRSAKGACTSKATNVTGPISTALENNFNVFIDLATAGTSPSSYTYDQVVAMGEIAKSVETTLNNIVSAYANATIVAAALDTTNFPNDELVVTLSELLAGKTKAADIVAVLEGTDTNGAAGETEYLTILESLAEQQDIVKGVLDTVKLLTDNNTGKAAYDGSSAFDGDDSSTDVQTIKTKIANPLLGANLDVEDASGNKLTSAGAIYGAGNAYLTGGVVGGAEGVAHYSGTFYLTEALGLTLYGGAANTTGALKTVKETVSAITEYPNATNSGPISITEFYGYVIDFAFRTNAANSNLQLQTAAVNRVYSDAEDVELATQGGGSTISFNFDGVTAAQAKKLLESVRVVFFNPDNGGIYKTAKVGNVTISGSVATGELYLIESTGTAYVLGKDAYKESATSTKTYQVNATSVAGHAINDTNFANYKATYTEAEWAAATAVDGGTLPATTVEPTFSGDPGTLQTKGTLGQDAYTEVESKTYVIDTTFKYGAVADDADSGVVLTSSNCTNYYTEITKAAYDALKSMTVQTTADTLAADKTAITAMSQNVVLKMSALVYMDGENIDNSAVAADVANSGTMKLNLQFSSSAALVPMENSDLRTELKNAGTNP